MKDKKYRAKDLTYYVFQIIKNPVKWYLKRKFNITLVKNEAKDDKGPFLITGNHVTAFDPIFSLVYLKPLIKFVAADANYDNIIKTFFMKIARVIPISKRYADVRTIRKLINEVNSGNAVGLYPEGGRTWHGETDELIKSTAKLIKLLGIKVYCQKIAGAYLLSPRWGKKINKGRVEIEIYLMLTETEIAKMTIDEIYQALKFNLYHNDYEYQRMKMIRLKGKNRAEYIERVLYVCPICKDIHTFKSHGNSFHCKSCQKSGSVNEYGFIEGDFPFDNVSDWYHFQKAYLLDYLKENEIKPLKLENVKYKLKINKKKKRYFINLYVNNENIILEYRKQKVVIEYKDVSEVSLTFKNTLIFYENKKRHEFVIEPFLHNNTSIVFLKEIINYQRGKSYAR